MKNSVQILKRRKAFSFIVMLLLMSATGFSQTKPGPSNTGYSGTLTSVSKMTITVNGTVVENKLINDGVTILANNVTIRNCLIDGGLYGIKCINGNTGLLIEDCEIKNVLSAGIYGGGFTARRLNIHESNSDGIKSTTNVVVENCWIHHLGKGEGAHADGVQSRSGGTNMIYRYNNFDMPTPTTPPYKSNSAFMMEPDGGQITNTVIEYNWMNGGNYTVYGSAMTGINVRNNIFGRDYRHGIFSGVAVHSCNVWEDTGAAIDGCNGTPTVAIPAINPGGGTFTNPVTVSITCATSGAEIRYTLDGSEPTQSSTLYTSSFVVSSTTTVKARGYKTDMNASSTASATFTFTSGGENVALGKSVTVSAYQDDANGTYPGSNLVDGNTASDARWSAEGYPQWAEIDLGSDYDLTDISLYTYQSRAYQYIIEAKADGGSYATIVDRSSNTQTAQPISDNVSTTARYVKITVSGASGYSGSWISLIELEVYGEPASGGTIAVTGVSVAPTSLSLEVGQTSDLTETVSPSNATNQSVTWSSSNTSIATVNSNGLVTAVGGGSATITVTTVDGEFTADCAVDVTVPVTGVSVSPASLSLNVSQTSDLTETVYPIDATNQSVTWSSSNTSVATVNASGLVTAISAGNATITVTTVDGSFTATCSVDVSAPGYLIDENFSSGTSNFSVITSGTWSVSGERYVLSAPGNTDLGLLGNISVHNTTVSGDFTLNTLINITGSATAWNDAAVIFNYEDVNNYYYVSLNESNDEYTKGIFRVSGGSPTELADITASISSDTDYTLEIIKSGTSIVVKLDGSQVASATATLNGGKVGYGSKNDAAQFDNLLVSVTGGSNANVTLAENASKSTVNIYPNPLNGNVLNIALSGYNSDVINVIIYDMMGRSVYNQVYNTSEQSEISISADELTKGMYIVSVHDQSTNITQQQKLIVE